MQPIRVQSIPNDYTEFFMLLLSKANTHNQGYPQERILL